MSKDYSINPQATFYDKWGKTILFGMACFSPLILYSAGKSVQSNVNKVEDWLPSTYVETSQLRWFREYFVSDQVVVISWKGCTLGDPTADGPRAADDQRIERLAQLLVPGDPSVKERIELPRVDPQTSAEAARCFKSVFTGRRLLDRLQSPPLSLDYDEAFRRLKGIAIGPDGRQTCVIVTLHDAATREMRKILGHGLDRSIGPDLPAGLLHRLIAAVGIPECDAHLGGPPVDNVAIDEEGERTLAKLAGYSALLGLGLAWWSLRNVVLTFIVFMTGVLSAAMSLGIVWLSGQNMDAIMMSMPSLVYVLAISGSVHLVNYYRDAVREHGPQGAAERAVAHAWKPAILCCTTTAIGLLSLYTSELVPIRKFGVYSAAGVMSMLVIHFVFLPAALHTLRIGRRWKSSAPTLKGDAIHSQPVIQLPQDTSFNRIEYTFAERLWERIARGITSHYVAVSLGCVLVIGLVGYGLTRAKTNINLLDLFDSQARILHDYAWLEDHLGMLVPLEVVVHFSSSSQLSTSDLACEAPDNRYRLTFLERMEAVASVQNLILKRFGPEGSGIVGGAMSAISFAPTLPSATNKTLGFMHRTALNVRLESAREEFANCGFYKQCDDGSELWRIGLRVAAFKGVDYGNLLGELNRLVKPVVTAHKQRVGIIREISKLSDRGDIGGARVMVWSQSREATPSATDENHSVASEVTNLLSKARCKVFVSDAKLSQTPLVQLERLAALDAVILTGQFHDLDIGTVRSVLPNAIDARDNAPFDMAVSSPGANFEWVRIVQTGVIPIVYKAQRSLLNSLVESSFWSFLTITPLMMLVSRSALAGMVAMIPNILPVLLVFGAMGWLGVAIDIGSMMSASIALGVAVDDTIHFLAWYRIELNQLQDRRPAIIAAYRRCATPTLQAAMISGLGLSVFAMSTFTPTQRFGWLMLTILVAGVIAELIMLPAILAGPLGRVFRPRNPSELHQSPKWHTVTSTLRDWYRGSEKSDDPDQRQAA